MTRSASKQDLVRSLGARPVVADALDAEAVSRAVASAEPEVIVHQLTALSLPMGMRDARHPDRAVATNMTNRLRTEATDHLLAAGRAAGARRVVAQSFGAFRSAHTGGPAQTEADPIDPDSPAPPRSAQAALLYLEQAVTTIEWGTGLALRYGGGGVWSHVHIEDAAAATAVAVERGGPGVCRGRRTCPHPGVAAYAGDRAGCQAAATDPALARPARGG